MIESDDICSVLAPLSITDSMISSITAGGANLPEDTNPAWSNSATYSIGQRVYVQSTHRVYESAKNNNTGKDPSLAVNRFTAAGAPNYWIEISPTNRYAMFDSLISTSTEATSPLSIKLTPGAFNGLAIFGIDADRIEISITDFPGGNQTYLYDAPLEGSQPADYYEYFFDQFRPQTQFIETDLVPYGLSEVTITFTKGSGSVKIGMIALGDLRPLGAPLRGASVEPQSYSYIGTDTFGNTIIKRRPSATSLQMRVKLNVEEANTVKQTIQDLLDVPVVVVGSNQPGYESLTVFGLLSGRMAFDDFGEPTLNLSVKGMT